jgi:hypothetical protein
MLKRIFSALVRFIVMPFSFLLVVFAYGLILTVIFFMLRYIIPLQAPLDTTPFYHLFLTVGVIFFFVNIFFNYTACTFIAPGSPPDCRQVKLFSTIYFPIK